MPGFGGLTSDPPPLEFQVAEPGKLQGRLVDAGLVDVNLETISKSLQFESGRELWDWVTNCNPIGARLVADLSDEEGVAVRESLESVLDERRDWDGPAILTNTIHIATGSLSR